MAHRHFSIRIAVAAALLAGCATGGILPQARLQGDADARAYARGAAQDIARQTGDDATEIESFIESQANDLTQLARLRTALPGGSEPKGPAAPLTLPPSAAPTANSVEVLIDADRIFDAVEAEVKRATKRIQLDLFMLGGPIGSRLAQAMEDRRRAGVDVRIVLDSHFAAMGPANKEAMATGTFLRDHGLAVRTFPLDSLLQPKSAVARASLIDHDKVVIVDDTAFVGAANLMGVASTNHDVMLRIRGPVAAEISAWTDLTFESSSYPAIWQTTKTVHPPALPAPTYRAGAFVPEDADTRARLTRTDRTEHSTFDRMLARIRASQKIDVGVFEMDDDTLKAELIAARKRGAQVRILLDRHQMDAKYTGKKAPAGIPNWLAARDFVNAGIPVHWYDPTLPNQEMHLKMALFDDRVSIVGSTNFTTKAFLNFKETGMELEGGRAVADMVAMFERDWTSGSTPVTTLTSQQRALAATIAFLDRNGIGWW